jgi:hypothetical protein
MIQGRCGSRLRWKTSRSLAIRATLIWGDNGMVLAGMRVGNHQSVQRGMRLPDTWFPLFLLRRMLQMPAYQA